MAHTYDHLGRRTGTTRGNGVSSTYGYDGIGRLTSLSHDGSGTAQDVTFTLGYNPAGQINSRTVSNSAYIYQPTPSPTTTTYANDDLNRVNSINGSGVTYSTDQNITGVLGTTQTYDDENNLASVTAGGATLNLATDPLGRLFSSTLGASEKRYQYDGAQLVGEYPSATSTTLSLRHVPGGSGLDNIALTWTGSGTTTPSYLLTDERGSVIGQSNSSGAITINAYDEYGLAASGNTGTFGYTGQMTLPGTSGLMNYRMRTYDPRIGRFMQPDPIGYGGGMNLFAYVGGDPMNFTDPWGLQEYVVTSICYSFDPLPSTLTASEYTPPTSANGSLQQCGKYSYGEDPLDDMYSFSYVRSGLFNLTWSLPDYGGEPGRRVNNTTDANDLCPGLVRAADQLNDVGTGFTLTGGAFIVAGSAMAIYASPAAVPTAGLSETPGAAAIGFGTGFVWVGQSLNFMAAGIYGGATGDWSPAIMMGTESLLGAVLPVSTPATRIAEQFGDAAASATSDAAFPMEELACD